MTNSLDVGLGGVLSHTPLHRSAGSILYSYRFRPALAAPPIIKAAKSRAWRDVNVGPTSLVFAADRPAARLAVVPCPSLVEH